MRLLSAIALGASLACTSLAAQPQGLPRATPDAVGLSTDALQRATAVLRQAVVDHQIAGAVAGVARHGKIAYLEPVGLRDLATRAPMDERTRFRIYSMTKSVTAVAVMMLQEEGAFALDDPVQKYLPEFAGLRVQPDEALPALRPSRPVTIRDLMLHTSGMSHRTSELYRRLAVRDRSDGLPEFVAKVARAPLMENPGTNFRYSESPTVLGRLVEVWSGRPFDAFLETRVLGPLGMHDTSFWVAPAEASRLATVYAPAADGGLRAIETEAAPFTEKPALLEGAVGLVSTVPDYLAFCQMLLNQGELNGVRVLRPATVAAMMANGLSPDVLRSRGGTMGWGLVNANVQMSPTSAVVDEVGWDGTAGTIFWVDPHRDLITVLMTQVQPSNPGGIRQRFKSAVMAAVR